ncbi:hypothetical protein BGZ93_010736 [Podila epicladia]|nr:hypothetical protein BGZ93_010736 [Podila epicladia]
MERNAIATYRNKLAQWKEASQSIVQGRTRRRMEEAARQSFQPDAPQHALHRRHRSHQQYPSRVGQVHFGPVKVTRLPTEDSDTSQRTEATRQNTLYNQYNNQISVDTTYHLATSNSYPGTGSRLEPHVLDDDNNGDVTPVSDADESPEGNSNTRAISPSLPSELELRRRQALAESEHEEDTESVDVQADEKVEKLVRRGSTKSESASPTAQILRKYQKTPVRETVGSTSGGDGANRTTDNPTNEELDAAMKRCANYSLPSDHSSPPMFDFTDHNDKDHGRRNTAPRSSISADDFESYDESDDDFHPPPRPQFPPKAPAEHSEEGTQIVEDAPQQLQGTSPRSPKGKRPAEDEAVVHDQSSKLGRRRHKEEWITSAKPRRNRQSIHPRQEDYEFLTEDDGGPSTSRGPVFNETERRKDKRKHMHASDCACCRRFYQLTGPLPLPDGYNAFFTPAPRPGQPEVWEQTSQQRLNQRIQTVSRHRVQHVAPATPPGYWDTDFPATPDRQEWDRIALERKKRKKQRLEQDAGPSSSFK